MRRRSAALASDMVEEETPAGWRSQRARGAVVGLRAWEGKYKNRENEHANMPPDGVIERARPRRPLPPAAVRAAPPWRRAPAARPCAGRARAPPWAAPRGPAPCLARPCRCRRGRAPPLWHAPPRR
eukprot:scaffold36074_cov60-Phaeocystis_antarctica.AAC.3